jgi:hypothetical protein
MTAAQRYGRPQLPSRRIVTLAKSNGRNGESILSDRLEYTAITASFATTDLPA